MVLRPRRGKRVQEHYLLIVDKREKSKVFNVFGREFRKEKRERICPEKCSKMPKYIYIYIYFFLGVWRGSMGIYKLYVILQLPVAIGQLRRPFRVPRVGYWYQQSCLFSILVLITYVKVLPDSDYADLGVLGKLWMYCFLNTKEIEIPTVG